MINLSRISEINQVSVNTTLSLNAGEVLIADFLEVESIPGSSTPHMAYSRRSVFDIHQMLRAILQQMLVSDGESAIRMRLDH